MILNTVQVKNFECINDSSLFTVDEKVTCLVGKNESGKMALMQAISKLNSNEPDGADFDLLEYPRRHMMDYQRLAESQPADALITTWPLSPEDQADLESIEQHEMLTAELESASNRISQGGAGIGSKTRCLGFNSFCSGDCPATRLPSTKGGSSVRASRTLATATPSISTSVAPDSFGSSHS